MKTKHVSLLAGISDIASNIKFSDTKMGLTLSAHVLILNGFIACRDDWYSVYSQFPACEHAVSGIVLFIYVSFMLGSILCSIWSIFPRYENNNKMSFWYIDTQAYSLEECQSKVFNATCADCFLGLCEELYTVNRIWSKKQIWARRAIAGLFVTLAAAAIFSIMVLWPFL